MFWAVLVTISRNYNQSRSPSIDEWMKKIWLTCTVESYASIKKMKPWRLQEIKPKIIMSNERIQSNVFYYMKSQVCVCVCLSVCLSVCLVFIYVFVDHKMKKGILRQGRGEWKWDKEGNGMYVIGNEGRWPSRWGKT